MKNPKFSWDERQPPQAQLTSALWSSPKMKFWQRACISVYRCGRLSYVFASFNSYHCTSNVTSRHRGPKRKLRAGYRAPSLKRTFYLSSSSVTGVIVLVVECNWRHIFHRCVWHRPLSLRYACIRSSGIILIPWATFLPNFVTFATSIFWASPWSKIAYSITRLIRCAGNRSFRFGTSTHHRNGSMRTNLRESENLARDSCSYGAKVLAAYGPICVKSERF